MGRKGSVSQGLRRGRRGEGGEGGEGGRAAHLVPYSAAPIDHFGDGLLVHAAAGLADGIDD